MNVVDGDKELGRILVTMQLSINKFQITLSALSLPRFQSSNTPQIRDGGKLPSMGPLGSAPATLYTKSYLRGRIYDHMFRYPPFPPQVWFKIK